MAGPTVGSIAPKPKEHEMFNQMGAFGLVIRYSLSTCTSGALAEDFTSLIAAKQFSFVV